MTAKFRNKYRIESARLKKWNYGSNGGYFITICTSGREHLLGEVKRGVSHLNEIGLLAQKYWKEIPNRFPHVQIGEYVIMPNHMHGIIEIDDPYSFLKKDDDGIADRDGINIVCTERNPMKSINISRIIQWYKGRVTFESRKINPHFGWQSRFYDHIIRDKESYKRISNYIRYNPKNWKEDKFGAQ